MPTKSRRKSEHHTGGVHERDSDPSFTIEELEEELICWACGVYRAPELGPIMEIVERILIDARNHVAKAKKILDAECEKIGCSPINSLLDLMEFEEKRKKRGVRMRPRSRGRWRGSFSGRFRAEFDKL